MYRYLTPAPTRYCLTLILLCTLTDAWAADMPTMQRALFVQAEQALSHGEMDRYHTLAKDLQDYPLYPYLQYTELRRNLAQAHNEEVDRFLARYGDTPLAGQLYGVWIRQLAQQSRWQDFLTYFRLDDDAELQCAFRQALLETDAKKEAMRGVEALWLTGKPQPAACNPIFAVWRASGQLTPALVWERIRLAMEEDQLGLVDNLALLLDEAEREKVMLWKQIYRNPALILAETRIYPDQPLNRTIVAAVLQRLVRHDPMQASAAWDTLKGRYSYTSAERAQIERRLALALALRGRPDALEHLAHLSPEAVDTPVREWRVRAALSLGDWKAVLAWIAQLDEAEREDQCWQYWRARALESLGYPEAQDIYRRLAQTRSYHGFLAADRLQQPYRMSDQPLVVSADNLVTLERVPAVARAHELFILKRPIDARREWVYATRGMNPAQLTLAAKLAQNWGWHDRAIATLSDTPYRDDLTLRFPIAHEAEVSAQARRQEIDPAWAYAVIRQESAFMPDARSGVGALGLMQLMPDTAQRIAHLTKTRLGHNNDLLDPTTNIRLGVAYLRRILDHFGGNTLPTTAAYNAGENKVRQWLPASTPVPADLWTETLPYRETRGYVENVFAFTVVYDYRLGRETVPLRVRMTTVHPTHRPNTVQD